MPDYRRAWHHGGTWFFTVNLLRRSGNDLLVRHIEDLRRVVARVRSAHPFAIHGWVVIPDHLHCLIALPENDTDFALRWRLIKGGFFQVVPANEWRSSVRQRRRERAVWQRRYWEHLIRNEADFSAHMDYIHFNPVKHGLAQRVADWTYSNFHRLVERGVYAPDWAGSPEADKLNPPERKHPARCASCGAMRFAYCALRKCALRVTVGRDEWRGRRCGRRQASRPRRS